MSSDFAVSTSAITQTVTGDRNIFTGTGDVNVVYNLPQADAEDRRGLLILLDRVKQFWVEGVLEQSVQHEALINLGKETKADAIEHPWEQVVELPNAASQRLAPDTRVADVFEQVGRLLLILGEPGSGKTITLLELARDLVVRARSDPSQPVPVVFNLSSWNVKFKALSDWVTEELKTKYLVPKRIGRSWLDGNRLLLLLDGLDEVQVDRREACIRAINAFLEDHGTPGLAVCSRLQEYTAEPVRLKMSGAICLQSLSATQIETYLSRLGSQLDALNAALKKDDVLRDLAKSPLMLSVMTLAYQGALADAFSTEAVSTAEVRRGQIFDIYVDRMLARKGRAGSEYDKRHVIGWLSWLAWNLRRHGHAIFLIEQLQPSWLTCVRDVFAYLLLSRLAAAIAMLGLSFALWMPLQIASVEIPISDNGWGVWSIFWVVGGVWSFLVDFLIYRGFLVYKRFFHPDFQADRELAQARGDEAGSHVWPGLYRKEYRLLMGLHYLGWYIIGIVCWRLSLWLMNDVRFFYPLLLFLLGAAIDYKWFIWPYDKDISANPFIWSWKSGTMSILRMLPVHTTILVTLLILMALSCYFNGELCSGISNVSDFLARAMIILTCYSICVALPLGLFSGGFMQMNRNQVHNCPMKMETIRFLISVSLIGIPPTALVLLLSAIGFIQISSGIYVLSFVLMFGMFVGLSSGLLDILRHWALRFISIHAGYMPRRYTHFLQHCSKVVFLRRVGGGYIFIHRLLLEHFAAMWEGGEKERGQSASFWSGSTAASAHADIFLSYAREDAATAQRLAKALEDEGWSVWWDSYIPNGKTFDEVLVEEIAAARCVVVLWSETSVESKWVNIEAHAGSNRGILIPAALMTNMERLPLSFRSKQTASLVGWKGEKSDPGYLSLVTAISNLLEPSRTSQR